MAKLIKPKIQLEITVPIVNDDKAHNKLLKLMTSIEQLVACWMNATLSNDQGVPELRVGVIYPGKKGCSNSRARKRKKVVCPKIPPRSKSRPGVAPS